MFLYKRSKKISHKESAVIGFVLAVMSLLVSVILGYLVPAFQGWLAFNGIFHLDIFLLLSAATIFFASQGLILFGFPLYYAKDKKSHMTGFQILIYALLWMLAAVVVIGVVAVGLNPGPEVLPVPLY